MSSLQTAGHMKPITTRGLMGCAEINAIKLKILIKIYLWEFVLQKLDEILVPSNPLIECKSNIGNTHTEEIRKESLDSKKVYMGQNAV